MGVKLWEGGFRSRHAAELAGAAAGGAATPCSACYALLRAVNAPKSFDGIEIKQF